MAMDTQQLQVRFLRSAFRETLIKPERVVVIPGYFLRWLPYLGPQRAWFVIAMRQAYFFAHNCRLETGKSITAPFQVSRRQLTNWSGLGANKVWELTKALENSNQEGEYLTWFLQAESYGQGIQKQYAFRIDMPLTPGDASSLSQWLIQHGIDTDPIGALECALEAEPREIYPFPPPKPNPEQASQTPNPQTVQQLVLSAAGFPENPVLYRQLTQLADRLAAKLQRPDDHIIITHYFLQEWVKQLGALPAWIVTVLRDKGYVDHHTGMVRDRITLSEGYRELANLLNVTERNIRDWVPPLEAMSHVPKEGAHSPTGTQRQRSWKNRKKKRTLIDLFLEKEGVIDRSPKGSTSYTFKVRMDEPLTPGHTALHQALLDLHHHLTASGESGEREALIRAINNLAARNKQGVEPVVRVLNNPGARSKQEQAPPVRVINKEPARIKQLKALIKPLKKQALSEIKQLLLTPLELSSQAPPPDQPPAPNTVGEGIQKWDIDRLLQAEGVDPKRRTQTLRKIKQDPQLQTRLLAWLIYGYEQHKQGGGVEAPALFALSRYTTSLPKQRYWKLAQLAPAALTQLLDNSHSPNLSSEEKQLLTTLETHGFKDVLNSQRSGKAGLPQPLLVEKNADKPEEAARLLRLSEPARPEPPDFPNSANLYWDQLRQLLGEKRGLQPTSLWLNDRELALSFLDQPGYKRAQSSLREHQSRIQEHYPGASFRVRMLRINQDGSSSAPSIDVAEEIVI